MSGKVSNKIVTDGLIFYVDAANNKSYVSGSTTWNDLSKISSVGTLTNGPTFNTGSDGSIVFDGVDDYIDFSDITSINNSTQATFEIWYKRYSSGSDDLMFVLGGTLNDITGIYIIDNVLYSDVSNGGGGNRIYYSYNLPFDLNWHHIVMTFIGNSVMRTYVDTVNVASQFTSIPSNIYSTAGNTFEFGRFTGSGPYYTKGYISNAKIYNKSLSATEVLQNYDALKSRFGL